MNIEQFNLIINELKHYVDYYERIGLESNKYTLYLANGESLVIKILKNNIAHLLGVNIDYLRQANRFPSKANSYECLKYFIDNAYVFQKLVSDKKMSFEKMFSKHIIEKLYSFKTNINVRTDDMYFILKYDRENTYTREEVADVCDYYLVRKQNDGYYLLGIVKSDNYNLYNPVTSRYYKKVEDFEEFMKRIAVKQTITYAYSIKIENYIQNYRFARAIDVDVKQEYVRNLISCAHRFNCTTEIHEDMSFVLNQIMQERSIDSLDKQVISLLTNSLRSNVPFDKKMAIDLTSDYKLKEVYVDLINACNDLMCNGSMNNKSYSNLENENNMMSKELEETKKELNKLREELEEKRKRNEYLEEENKKYLDTFSNIEELMRNLKK